MIDKINYLGYAFQNILYRKLNINKSIEKKRIKYGCHSFVNANESNKRIGKALTNKETYAVARIGSTELLLMRQHKEIQLGIRKKYSADARQQLCQWSGFFPNDVELINQFAELMVDSLKEIDLLV